MQFWLGTHLPNWLERTSVPLMVSHGRLRDRRTLPRARGPWFLDSKGFTELRDNGGWTITPAVYAASAQRYQAQIGNLQWAAIQDWMCEPFILAKTGLSVSEHQENTINSWFDLHDLAPDVPWIPVLQGWAGRDYQRHVDRWLQRGVDLFKLPLIGVGTVCRRQRTREGVDIFALLSWLGLKLHGFGVKISALRMARQYLSSGDSMSWSYTARREKRCLPGHTHKNGANCFDFAMQWRQRLRLAA